MARIALDAVLLDPPIRAHFADQFVLAAGVGEMAHPARIEDKEHFIELAVDRLLADRELRDILLMLVRKGLTDYMEPQ